MPFIVGLTGGIGSGKTAVSDYFSSLDITVVDADVVSRLVVEKGQPALNDIAEHFGNEILTETGDLNRPLLREKIFSDSSEKIWLEKLLHPLINKEIRDQLAASQSPYTILVSPLLLETNQYQLADRILLVDVEEALQVERTVIRDNNSKDQVRAIMQTQASRKERLQKADDVIVNDGSLADLHKKIDTLNDQFFELAKAKAAI